MQKDTFLGENHTFPSINLQLPRGGESNHPDGIASRFTLHASLSFPPPRGSRWGD